MNTLAIKRVLLARALEMREVININPTNYTVGLCAVLTRGALACNRSYYQEILRQTWLKWPECVAHCSLQRKEPD